MPEKKLSPTLSTTLMVVTVFIVTLLLVPGAWSASKYKTLYKFKGGRDGSRPFASLVFDPAGNLYGTTYNGGGGNCRYGCGTVFQLTPNGDGSWTENVLHSFDDRGTDGYYPAAGLIFDSTGNLYGTTYWGGRCFGCGTVFKLTSNGDGSWTESVLHLFTYTEGYQPKARVIFDPEGNLYGTTFYGGAYGDYGTVFQLTPNGDGSWTHNMLHSFQYGDPGGFLPYASLVFDAAGNLYGTTAGGGVGAVFELTPNGDGSWAESVLHSFNSTDGASPYAGLIFDSAGNLYGTTYWGGGSNCDHGYGCGTVFQLIPNEDGNWTEKVLHRFKGDKDGSNPYSDLIFDLAGNLYGTTTSGGAYGYGTIFKLKPSAKGGWKKSVIHSFRNHPGASPFAGLLSDAAGNLYGTAEGDGTKTWGSVFEVTP